MNIYTKWIHKYRHTYTYLHTYVQSQSELFLVERYAQKEIVSHDQSSVWHFHQYTATWQVHNRNLKKYALLGIFFSLLRIYTKSRRKDIIRCTYTVGLKKHEYSVLWHQKVGRYICFLEIFKRVFLQSYRISSASSPPHPQGHAKNY